jgi:YidC/Oxa1 family membrane protein insertase
MDTKRTLLGMVAIMVLVLGWNAFLQLEFNRHPNWRRPDQSTDSTTQPTTAPTMSSADDNAAAATPGGLHVLGGPVAAMTLPAISNPTTAPASQSTVAQMSSATTQAASLMPQMMPTTAPAAGTSAFLGSVAASDPTYAVGLEINTKGAGLDEVVLNRFRENVDSNDRYSFQHPYDLNLDQTRPLATAAISIDGNSLPLADQIWTPVVQDDKAKAEYTLVVAAADGKPLVRLVRDYKVLPESNDPSGPQGYEVEVDTRVENLTPLHHIVTVTFNGPTIPLAETARQASEVVAGFNNQDTVVNLEHRPIADFKAEVQNITAYQGLPLLWFGASSNYFNAIVRPTAVKGAAPWIGEVDANALNPASSASDRVVALQFTSTKLDLGPAAVSKMPMRVFFGPKSRALLDSKYYGQYPMAYDDTLVMVGGCYNFCTFPALIYALYYLLWSFHLILRDWGLSIIALVCLVRLCLHPITKRSQVSMMKMQKMGPEMERLKKKFGDDKEGFAKAQMDLYKQIGFTPVLGCLPMFLQMPIFIALWRALQTTFELRQAPFLYVFGMHLTWIRDLSAPDALISFGGGFQIPLLGWHVYALNILPIGMAVVTFVNQKYFMPQPVATTPEQAQQQKMMVWMSLLFPVMFYTFPSGLNLYYLTSTSMGIFESKRIRAHIKAREEAEKAGKVIVDGGSATRKKKRESIQDITGGNLRVNAKKPRGGLAGWLESLQAKADQLRQDAQRNKP